MSEGPSKEVAEVFEAVKGRIVREKDLHDNFNRLADEKLSFLEKLYLNHVEKVFCAGLSIAQVFNYRMGKRVEDPYYGMIGDGSNGFYVRKGEVDNAEADHFVHVARDIKLSNQLESILPFKLQRKVTELTAEAYEACFDYTSWKDQGAFVPHSADPDRDSYIGGASPE